MILVVFAAISLGIGRWIVKFGMNQPLLLLIEQIRTDRPLHLRHHLKFASVCLPVYPLLATWSLSLLVLRLRSPRPRGPRLWRQPGFTASVAAVFIAGINGLIGLATMIHYFGVTAASKVLLCGESSIWLRCFLPNAEDAPQVGTAIAAAWFILALSGRWKAEPGWIDRLGRVVGALWLIVSSLPLLREFFPE
ncbi:hypothetical protein TA3x_001068 [Tundrisphaera sp. TA3]|uniref:hypothetical protein n=1 Tax=Tundrisphaera sp. TA3 TaxID=3435775 RepID=UPI003EBD4414